ncbi:MAG: hypothetical protein ACOCSQ_00195 [Planctomycetota bacterium]
MQNTIALSPAELRSFSVPHVFCLLGERQYVLGLGSVIMASDMRINCRVKETPEDFRLMVEPADLIDQTVKDHLRRWRGALESAARSPDELRGLDVVLEIPEAESADGLIDRLASPAAAVSLATVLQAHRREGGTVQTVDLARTAGEMLEEVAEDSSAYPSRYDALCRASAGGGVNYIAPSDEPLNAQLLVPPESLILIYGSEAGTQARTPGWERSLLGALQKLGGSEELISAVDQEGLEGLFEMTTGDLEDDEIAVLYALVRVRQMIQELLETLDREVRDNDRLAEVCDEESTLLEDYFGFAASELREIRQKSVEAGALGAKFTHMFGGRPALLCIAPGRRDEVTSMLADEYGRAGVRRLNVDSAGIKSEMQ